MTDPCEECIDVIDRQRAAPVAAGLTAAVCVGPDGDEVLWLLCEDVLGRLDVEHGCACPDCAPHEQMTVTPAPVRERDVE